MMRRILSIALAAWAAGATSAWAADPSDEPRPQRSKSERGAQRCCDSAACLHMRALPDEDRDQRRQPALPRRELRPPFGEALDESLG